MAKVNMQAWYQSNEEKLAELKTSFVEAMLEDEDFFFFNDDDVLFEHVLKYKYPLAIALKPVDDLISELETATFIMPDKPDELNSGLIERYNTHVFDDSRLDGFEAKLKTVYSSFSTASAFSYSNKTLTEAIQAAFYDYKYDRDKEVLIARIDEAANAWAADGYQRAPGAFGYNVSQMVDEFDRQRFDGTEGVFRDLAQTVQDNIRNSIENGAKIEELHMDFAIKYSELSKVFIQSSVDAYVAEIQKRIDEQNAQMSKIQYLTKSMGLDTQADIAKNRMELEERMARLSAYIQATNVFNQESAENIKEKLKLANNISDGYGAIFSSYGSLFTGISYEE